MTPRQRFTLVTSLPLLAVAAACGGSDTPVMQDESGKYRVIGQCSPRTLSAAVDKHATASMVVAFDQRTAAVVETVDGAERSPRPFVLCIGPEPEPEAGGERIIGDCTIVATSGARDAVELALLACNGVEIPSKRIELGPRLLTPANRAAGGQVRLAPGDAYLAMLRAGNRQHLDPNLEVDISFGVALVFDGPTDAPSSTRLANEIRAAIDSYPQLQLAPPTPPAAPGASAEAAPAEVAGDLCKRGVNALLLVTSNPTTTKAVLAVATRAEGDAVPVIVIDPLLVDGHECCHIGCSPEALGRTMAEQAKALLPEGGAMLTCLAGEANDGKAPSPARLQHDAFCKAMQFRP
ncbi:MAG: hypothetical protein AB8H80_10885 [Planctomycetota bacterium]